MTHDAHANTDAWTQYRRARRRMYAGLAFQWILGGVGSALARVLHGASWLIPVGFIAAVVIFLAAFARMSGLRCPRCRRTFFREARPWGGIRQNMFARRCLHCGLPKWAPGPSPAAPAG